ncbi:uncharacterized protein LOC120454046 [Drosophila santomea]|uniref:uncharacterized protein LOC120454046 n=1 Tax=Drosophila santomea TaxID=129105 RepID=UPI001953D1E9|nr:uncharacterized protein LOC120454046 [Drosophila santomea]
MIHRPSSGVQVATARQKRCARPHKKHTQTRNTQEHKDQKKQQDEKEQPAKRPDFDSLSWQTFKKQLRTIRFSPSKAASCQRVENGGKFKKLNERKSLEYL